MTINFSFKKHEIINLSLLLILAFVVRVSLFPIPGYNVDLNTFSSWFNTAAQHGPRVFYNVVQWSDYPPLNIYLFWGFGSIANIFSFNGTNLMFYLIKLLPSIFDIMITAVIFVYFRKHLNFRKSLLFASCYVFNPAVIINSAIWGQLDAIYTFFILLSLIFVLDSKPKLAIILLVLGLLTKPQSIAIAPLILFLICRKHDWKTVATSLLMGIVTIFAVIIPFEWSNPIVFLSDIYLGAYQGYSFTTLNAFNLWALGGLWVNETVFLFLTGWILFGTLCTYALFVLHKRFSEDLFVIFIAFTLLLGFFMLPTRIHERYLFPAFSILTLTLPFLKKIRPIYVILSATFFINQAYVLYYLNLGTFISPGDLVVLTVSLINLIILVYILTVIWSKFKGRSSLISEIKNNSDKIEETKKFGD